MRIIGTRPSIAIEPVRGWEAPNLAELWRYRHLLAWLLRRDVRKRYRQTFLGPVWLVLPPLVKMGVFSLAFGWIASLPSEGIPYPLFVYAALLPWELLSNGTQRGVYSLVKHVSLMSKTYFPRLVLPLSEAATALVDFAVSFVILVPLAWAYGFPPSFRLLLVAPLLVVAAELALTLTLLCAALQARYRDTKLGVGYLLQAWFYITPVVYSAEVVVARIPESAAWVYRANPMVAVAEGFRWCVTGTGQAPGWGLAVLIVALALPLCAAATVFRRAENSIVDVL